MKKNYLIALFVVGFMAVGLCFTQKMGNKVVISSLKENVEALSNAEAGLPLRDCYDREDLLYNETSATSVVICPEGTTDYLIGKCTILPGRVSIWSVINGKCYE